MRNSKRILFPNQNDEGDQKWWTAKKPDSNESQSISIDVEITSYGLLSLIKAKRLTDALPYFKWLLAQRNERGGFFGTQDTVIGLEALALYSRHMYVKDSNVQLKIQADNLIENQLEINSENSLLLQTVDLPAVTKSVHLHASGHGLALFQLSYQYNLNEADAMSTFVLALKVLETTAGRLNVQVCSRFVKRNKFQA